MTTSRRILLQSMFAAAGALGVRSLVTGLPIPFLLHPRRAVAAPVPTAVILSTARDGDPLNANCPGSYVTGVSHPPDPRMAPLPVQLGGVTSQAAGPWNQLGKDYPELLGRLCFIHHRCSTVAHTELESLLRLHGAARSSQGNGSEMLPSLLASELAAFTGAKQVEPVSLGTERMSFQGRWLDSQSPSQLKALFSGAISVDQTLLTLRQNTLDAIYSGVKASGSKTQMEYLDRWAMSRGQAQALGSTLGNLMLETADEELVDGSVDQFKAAVALLAVGLNLSSVVTVHVRFGGDNHEDPSLQREADQTVEGVASIGALWSLLSSSLPSLRDRVTFATLNTFGRSLKAQNGRAHNGNHHVMVMFGPTVKPGVYGGLIPVGNDFGASPIDSQTGQASPSGDIRADEKSDETLLAAAATLATAAGVPQSRIALRLPGAKRIVAATL